jgi:uncharacterized protein involved in exopolysaccharide biosynthesis
MRTFAAEGNPELQRTQEELQALKRELGRVEGSSLVTAIGGREKSDNSGLDNLSRLRDVKYYEFLYELLAKQYELAKIDEAKDATIIQVMDGAIQPDRRAKPKRTLIVLLSTVGATLVSVLLAFVVEAISQAKLNPGNAARVMSLRDYLRWK